MNLIKARLPEFKASTCPLVTHLIKRVLHVLGVWKIDQGCELT
jgi:hypothetical protein